MGVLETHVWGCRADKPAQPDRIVFDFDPHEDVPWTKIKGAATEMRQRLKELSSKVSSKPRAAKACTASSPSTASLVGRR